MPKLLSLRGCIAAADALNCQRAIAAAVVAEGGDDILPLKGNQGSLHDDVRPFLENRGCLAEVVNTTVDGDHERIETRSSLVCTDVAWLQELHNWPELAAIGRVSRIRETAANITPEIAYYVLDSALSAEHIGRWRGSTAASRVGSIRFST